jgi:hypothetical protein
MADETATNQAAGAATQSSGTPSGAAQTTGAGEATQAVGAGGEIVVGNQKFQDAQALSKAYAELQKGHTQANQRHSEEMKAYEWLRSRLGELKQNPSAWQTFVGLLKGGTPPAQAAQAANAQAQQTQAPERGLADVHTVNQMNLMNARIELMEFSKAHPDLSEEDVDGLVDWVLEKDKEGKTYSLEDAHRLTFYEKNAANVFKKGQESVTAAQKAGANAQALGSTAPTAQVSGKTEDDYGKLNTEQERYDWIVRNMRKTGVKTNG